jgi:hypothetical protein
LWTFVHGPEGCVQAQPALALEIDVAVSPVGTASVTVTMPLVDPVPTFETVIVYLAPICP